MHRDTLVDLPEAHLRAFFANVQLLCRAVQEGVGAQGTFVAVNNTVSQTVPHLHVHVVPRRRRDGLRGFFWPRHPYRDEAHRREVAEALRRSVEARRRP